MTSNPIARKNALYFGILLLCLINFSLVVILPNTTFLNLVKEDGLFENIGALFFFGNSILFFVLYFREDKIKATKNHNYFNSFTKRSWFLLLAILFFFLLGEEISWGQRILGFATPEGISKKNIQGETNLHNLDIFHLYDEDHNRKEGIASYFTAKKLFVYLFLAYLLLLPIGVRFVKIVKDLTHRIYLPIPDIRLGILFSLNILLFKAFKPFAMGLEDGPRGMGRGLSEIEECNFAIILFLLPFVWFAFSTKKAKETENLTAIPKQAKA